MRGISLLFPLPSSLSSLRLFPLPCGCDLPSSLWSLSSIISFSSFHRPQEVEELTRGEGSKSAFHPGGGGHVCPGPPRLPGPLLFWVSWPSKTAQDRAKSPKERTKSPQERPKTASRSFKNDLRSPKSGSRAPKSGPRRPQEAPRATQEPQRATPGRPRSQKSLFFLLFFNVF